MTSRASALKHFKKVDPHFFAATERHHESLPVRLEGHKTSDKLFDSLISTVISQQLGLKAASAIYARVKSACKGKITPRAVLALRTPTLRKAGLSGAKIKTIKAVATAVKSKSLNLSALKTLSEIEATEKLVAIWGLGPWSAEMFLMFALGRSDVFSPGDLGLVRAIEAIYKLPKGAPREALLAIAEKWAPYRTFASLLLWRTRDNLG
jgi:DNA-3-methyladenine glycosylase II